MHKIGCKIQHDFILLGKFIITQWILLIFSNLSKYISSIILTEFWWNQTDFNYPSIHYLKGQCVALIIVNHVDQQSVIKIIRLLLISLILSIFNIQYVSIKSGRFQQSPSITWAMTNLRIRVLNLIIFYYMSCLFTNFHKTSIAQKLGNRSISYSKFKILSNWNLAY